MPEGPFQSVPAVVPSPSWRRGVGSGSETVVGARDPTATAGSAPLFWTVENC